MKTEVSHVGHGHGHDGVASGLYCRVEIGGSLEMGERGGSRSSRGGGGRPAAFGPNSYNDKMTLLL